MEFGFQYMYILVMLTIWWPFLAIPAYVGWAAAFELIPAYFAYISINVSDVSRSFKKKTSRIAREKTHKCVFTLEISKIFSLRAKNYLEYSRVNLSFVRSVDRLFTLQIT